MLHCEILESAKTQITFLVTASGMSVEQKQHMPTCAAPAWQFECTDKMVMLIRMLSIDMGAVIYFHAVDKTGHAEQQHNF